MTKHALLILIFGGILFAIMARACARPRASDAAGRAYVPWVAPMQAPAPCDYRRDVWPCWVATMTAAAAGTPVPTSTRASATWAPSQVDPRGRVWLPIAADVRGPGRVCSAAWAPNGAWYLAAHCRAYNPLLMRVAGVPVTAWQSDASGRDLAQARAGDGGSAPALAHPSPGDAVTLRPARGDVGGTYYGGAWARQYADGYEIGPVQFEAARPMGVVCVGALLIGQGDSGGGMYRDSDGALGGVVVAAEADADYDAWCGDGQRVLVELVP